MNQVIPRATVDSIVAHRNRALTLYADAFDALTRAADALGDARKAAALASPGLNRFNHHSDADRRNFLDVLKVPQRADFIATARRLTDVDVWSHIVTITDLEKLMDKKAKDQLHKQLIEDPPEVTRENVLATLEQFRQDADTIFKRGIAECFTSLDRRFRSHDGWKIGSRIILEYAFNDFGSWNYYRNQRDTILDIERTFLVLDGRSPTASYSGIIDAIQRDRGSSFGKRQSETEGEFFKVRAFKNGNAHLWFKRDDLVERVNALLGEYYGAPIPEDRGPDEDTGLDAPKTEIAKNFAYFPTPDAVVSDVLDAARLWTGADCEPLTVLEPSAGSGALSSACLRKGAVVDCIEIHRDRAQHLRASARYRRVTQCDFLALQPHPDRLYDRVVMNPPFDRERDIDHVWHALRFLKPDGRLVAVMSAGTEFRETRKAKAFREEMKKLNADWRDLPLGSFASVGTNCNTLLLTVDRSRYHP